MKSLKRYNKKTYSSVRAQRRFTITFPGGR